jgi:hypothetical protein
LPSHKVRKQPTTIINGIPFIFGKLRLRQPPLIQKKKIHQEGKSKAQSLVVEETVNQRVWFSVQHYAIDNGNTERRPDTVAHSPSSPSSSWMIYSEAILFFQVLLLAERPWRRDLIKGRSSTNIYICVTDHSVLFES